MGTSALATVRHRIGADGTVPAVGPATIAHRGGAGPAPENTLAAIDLARVHVPDFVEIDVQLSADGVPVVVHDATLTRTTNVETVFPDRAADPVVSFTYDELRRLDAGSWYAVAYAGERIPTLREVLELAYPALGVVIELKHPASSPGLARAIAAELAPDPRWRELAARGRLAAISFDAAAVYELHALRPDVPVLTLGPVPASAAELAAVAAWAEGWGTSYRTLDPAGVARVHAAGLRLNVYTVNDPDAMRDVIDLGADLVTSDYPGRLAEVLAGRDPLPEAGGTVLTGYAANARAY